MPLTFKITPPSPNDPLIIGKDGAPKNKIRFTVTVEGEGPFFVKVKIPGGENGVFLDKSNVLDCKMDVSGGTQQIKDIKRADQGRGETFHSWENPPGKLLNGAQSTTYTVELHNICCTGVPGPAMITVECKPPGRDIKPEERDFTIYKVDPPTGGNPILFLLAEPLYLPPGGGDVTLTWRVQPRTQVELLTKKAGGFVPVGGSSHKELLTENHMYTLKEVKDCKDTSWERQAYVQIGTSGWATVPLRSMGGAFPSTIFDTGNEATKLYAIFCRDYTETADGSTRNRELTLRSSADGVTDWGIETGARPVPKAMESSPGLHMKNRLWLIGGSAVDPERRSREIWYSNLSAMGNASQWTRATITNPTEFAGFEPRMGHACLRIDEKTFWVMGGEGPARTLNDVWSFEVADNGSLTANKLTMGEKWAHRCMFGAVKWDQDSNSIWVFGGMDTPNGNPRSDMWRLDSTGAKDWKKRAVSQPGKSTSAPWLGTGVAVRGTTMSMVLSVRLEDPVVQSYAPYFAQLARDSSRTNSDAWTRSEEPPPYDKNNIWITQPISITAVWFKDRLIVRHLHRDTMRDLTQVKPLLHFYTPPPTATA